jgi:hypothetical protein
MSVFCHGSMVLGRLGVVRERKKHCEREKAKSKREDVASIFMRHALQQSSYTTARDTGQIMPSATSPLERRRVSGY